MPEKIAINFKEVVIKSPDGEVLPADNLYTLAATHLWKSAPTIPLFEASLKLHKGDSVEVSEQEIGLLMQIFLPQTGWALPFVAFAMLSYLEGKLK